MPNRYLINGGGVYTDPTDDIWHSLQNQGAGDTFGFNEAADVAIMNAFTVGNFTLNVNMACIGWQSTGYAQTFALAANDLAVSGSFVFEGTITGSGDISVGNFITLVAGSDLSGWTGTLIADWTGSPDPRITTAAVTIPNLTVDNDGVTTCVLQDNMTVGDLTYTAGVFTTTGRTVSLRAAGVTSNVDWNTASYQIVHLIMPDNAKMEMIGHVTANEYTFGTGVGGASVASAGNKSLSLFATSDDAWHQPATSGTVAAWRLTIYVSGGNRTIGLLDGSNFTQGVSVQASGASRTLTLTDDWTTGAQDWVVFGFAAGDTCTIDTDGYDLTAGALTLGGAGDRSGVLDFATGRHAIDSITPGHNDNQNNGLILGTCFLTLANNADLTNTNPVTVTSTAATIYGAVMLTDWGCTGWAWVPQGTNGTGNGQMLWGAPAAQLVGGGLVR